MDMKNSCYETNLYLANPELATHSAFSKLPPTLSPASHVFLGPCPLPLRPKKNIFPTEQTGEQRQTCDWGEGPSTRSDPLQPVKFIPNRHFLLAFPSFPAEISHMAREKMRLSSPQRKGSTILDRHFPRLSLLRNPGLLFYTFPDNQLQCLPPLMADSSQTLEGPRR